jgi:transposase
MVQRAPRSRPPPSKSTSLASALMRLATSFVIPASALPWCLLTAVCFFGQAPIEAMTKLSISTSNGYRWLRGFRSQARLATPLARRPGRAPKLSPEQRALLLSELKKAKARFCISRIYDELVSRGKLPAGISHRTLARYATQAGWSYGNKPRKHKGLTQPQMDKRVSFCKVMGRHTTINQLVCFTDSSIFKSDDLDYYQREWTHSELREQLAEAAVAQKAWRVHAYGGITFYGATGLITSISGTKGVKDSFTANGKPLRGVGAAEYQQNILPKLLHDAKKLLEPHHPGKWIFQQDGAGAHTLNGATAAGKAALELLKRAPLTFGVKDLPPWPPSSPDLSLIENVWAEMCRRLTEWKVAQPGGDWPSQAAFENDVRKAWTEATSDTKIREAMFRGFTKRLKLCVTKKGRRV